jgi:PPP family 3-phenylpropionic acid transporter
MQIPQHADARSGAPKLFALRAALLFCAPMLVNGISLPYFPVFLQYLKMNEADIGIILAIPHIVRTFATHLGSVAADRASDRSTVLIWSGSISFLMAVLLFFTGDFWPVLIVYALQGIFYAPYVPIAEAVLISGVRRWGFDYGSLRLWGSVAFILSNLVGGWLFGLYGGAMVLPMMAGFFMLTILMGVAAPRLGKADHTTMATTRPIQRSNPMTRPDFVLVMAGAALVQGSHGMLFAFASIHWTALGFSGTSISWLWTAGVLAEISMFFISGKLMARFSVWTLILTGCTVAVFRWIIFAQPLSYWGYFALQCGHAFTFAIIHIGIQKLIMLRVDERQEASAQGFYTTLVALCSALAALSSGYLYELFAIDAFYIMAAVAIAGMITVLTAMSLQPQRLGSGGNTREA